MSSGEGIIPPTSGGSAGVLLAKCDRSKSCHQWLSLLEEADSRAQDTLARRAKRSEYLKHLWEELGPEGGGRQLPVSRILDNLWDCGVSISDPRLRELRE